MRPPVSLTIPQVCHQSWAAMTPTTAGRHCAAREKTVVDFTLKTDAEIRTFLAGATSGRTCGRFAAGQLERPLQRAVPAAPTRWRPWLAAAVAVWAVREGNGTTARAQAPMEQRSRPDTSLSVKGKPDREGVRAAFIVRGVVLDSASHEGLPGVTVLIRAQALVLVWLLMGLLI